MRISQGAPFLEAVPKSNTQLFAKVCLAWLFDVSDTFARALLSCEANCHGLSSKFDSQSRPHGQAATSRNCAGNIRDKHIEISSIYEIYKVSMSICRYIFIVSLSLYYPISMSLHLHPDTHTRTHTHIYIHIHMHHIHIIACVYIYIHIHIHTI